MLPRLLHGCCVAAVLFLAPLTSSRPYSGHFTLIRPDGNTYHSNYLTTAANKRVNKNSPVYFIKLGPPNTSTNFLPGAGFSRNPSVRSPFFSVMFPSNGRPYGVYPNRGSSTDTVIPFISSDKTLGDRYLPQGTPKHQVPHSYGHPRPHSNVFSILSMNPSQYKTARSF